MGEVVQLRPASVGNGAREAMQRVLVDMREGYDNLEPVDAILALLWIEGFKVTPLEPGQ